jgi:hypothetical protein
MEMVSPQAVTTPKGNHKTKKTVGKKLSRKQLINRLNSLNFNNKPILVNLQHQRFGNTLTLAARPDPCPGETLTCTWAKPEQVPTRLTDYKCTNFLLNDGKLSFAVTPQTLALSEQGASFSLPAVSRETAQRLTRRHMAHNISAHFMQNSCLFRGTLIDFCFQTMRVDISFAENQSINWLNPEQSVELTLLADNDILFTCNCRILREQPRGGHIHTVVVEPTKTSLSRFRNSQFRSSRHQLVPAPNASFKHPLTGRLTNLLIRQISGTGFSIDEDATESLLLPGLVIPDMQVQFTKSFSISCRAQVVYRSPVDEETKKIHFGIAFLDMSPEDHMQILSIVHRAENEQAHLSQTIDTERLLDFFFNAGFIYPEKYASVATEKENLKKTYEKLYSDCPTIARHFIQQDNDRIYAHMAAVRFYQNAWLVHHHAAADEQSTRAGLDVLNQTTRWLNDSRNIPSIHLDFFFCYFRDKNRFPMRLFGGIYEGVNDLSACSLDPFAYYHHNLDPQTEWDIEHPWSLQKATAEDLQELGYFYEASSGGLLTNAFDLQPESLDDTSLDDIYRQYGFSRVRHTFALKDNTNLKAIFVVNLADFGLNLSELTSAIQVFIPESEELPRPLLDLILSLLCLKFKKTNVPVLMYPYEAAEKYGINIEKKYMLWIFNSSRMDSFFRELKKLTRTIGH